MDLAATTCTTTVSARWPGMLLAILLASLACLMCLLPLSWLHVVGPLMPAMLLGLLLSQRLGTNSRDNFQPGIGFARGQILRIGIVLYGLRISLLDLQQVGINALLTDLTIVVSTLAVAAWIGIRLLKMEPRTAILVGAGSAVCGAAAILATAPVLRARNSDISVAIATVVLFGSAAMLLYPTLYTLPAVQQFFGHSDLAFGRMIGATVHEVAQVAAAAQPLDETAAHAAVITKMIRVMLLVPVLFGMTFWLKSRADSDQHHGKITPPWFALVFLLMPLLNASGWLPTGLVETLLKVDTFLLATAMAALGLDTRFSAVIQAGKRPLLLGAMLFVFLLLVGMGTTYVFNRGL